MNPIHWIIFLFTIVSFSSCFTSFHSGQDALPLEKHALEFNTETGANKLGLGLRYGFLNRLDGGIYYNFDPVNERLKFPLISGDVKYKLLGGVEKHYAISTGVCFGTAIDYSHSWNETTHHYSEEDVWYHYGGTALDAYLPLYFSCYSQGRVSVFSLTWNPYFGYRFGFYDHFHQGYYQNNYNVNTTYKNLGKGLIGNAFSIKGRFKHTSLYGVLNLLSYYDGSLVPSNGGLSGEIILGFSFILNSGKNRKQEIENRILNDLPEH